MSRTITITVTRDHLGGLLLSSPSLSVVLRAVSRQHARRLVNQISAIADVNVSAIWSSNVVTSSDNK